MSALVSAGDVHWVGGSHMTTPVELHHLYFERRLNITFAGMRFHNISGAVQRRVERFVYQLQRDARRFDKDDDFY